MSVFNVPYQFRYMSGNLPPGVHGTSQHFAIMWDVVPDTGITLDPAALTETLAHYLMLGLQAECALSAYEYGGCPVLALPANPNWLELCAALDHLLYTQICD